MRWLVEASRRADGFLSRVHPCAYKKKERKQVGEIQLGPGGHRRLHPPECVICGSYGLAPGFFALLSGAAGCFLCAKKTTCVLRRLIYLYTEWRCEMGFVPVRSHCVCAQKTPASANRCTLLLNTKLTCAAIYKLECGKSLVERCWV